MSSLTEMESSPELMDSLRAGGGGVEDESSSESSDVSSLTEMESSPELMDSLRAGGGGGVEDESSSESSDVSSLSSEAGLDSESLRRPPELTEEAGLSPEVESSPEVVESDNLRRITFLLAPRSLASTTIKSLERRATTKREEMKKRMLMLFIWEVA